MFLNRSIFNNLYKEILEPEVSILLGARQVGKSTLLQEIAKKAQAVGLVTRYYNLELSADLEELTGSDRQVFEKLTHQGQIIFIDEFPYLPNAFKIFKAVYDSRAKVKIYASGSSSIEIHKHLKESLAGRFRKTVIFPLSWEEYKNMAGARIEDYCVWGGMPGLLHRKSKADKAELLENIVSTYLAKDVKALVREEHVRAFNQLLYLLAQSQGSVVAVSSLARETGLPETTISRHLEILSQTYVCHEVASFSGNLANELKKSKKYYLYDLGIRNHLLKDYGALDQRSDTGAIMESLVFLHLRWQLKPNMELRFWRTKKGQEVDFILLKNRVPIPIEVKSRLSGLNVPDGLKFFLKNYPRAPYGVVFNQSLTGQTQIFNRPVHFKKVGESAFWQELQQIT